MKTNKIHLYTVACLLMISGNMLMAQEPGFMQYNADPLNISPALAGRYDTDFRVMVNARSQWLGKSSTYNTRQVSVDAKMFEVDESNYFGIGGMFISDKAMDGLYKSNYFSLNGSYHFALDANGSGVGLGIGVVGNQNRIDFSQLTFDQQLSSSGFDMTLASGEMSMRNSTSHVSATAGLMYTYESDFVYFDAGVSGYRFMNFQRSFYNDPKQSIAPRYTAHAYLSMTLNDRLSLQASAMAEHSTGPIQMLHLGAHYRSTGTLAPTVGYTVGNIDLGLSSDVPLSSKTSGSVVNRALELTMSYNMFSTTFRRKVGGYRLPY